MNESLVSFFIRHVVSLRIMATNKVGECFCFMIVLMGPVQQKGAETKRQRLKVQVWLCHCPRGPKIFSIPVPLYPPLKHRGCDICSACLTGSFWEHGKKTNTKVLWKFQRPCQGCYFYYHVYYYRYLQSCAAHNYFWFLQFPFYMLILKDQSQDYLPPQIKK